MKKIILISLISLSLMGCTFNNKMKETPKETSDYDFTGAEVKVYIDPDTNVEYLIFDFKGAYESPVVVPRYNSDGSLKCLD